MQTLIKRNSEFTILEDLRSFPVVAILGSRQCGKSTLAKMLKEKIENFIYLDLESPSDLRKLDDPELFFDVNKNKTVCLDEIQFRQDLFPVLRSIVDRNRRNGQILILGSASRDLIRQSSESLAGRISFIELTPFVISEIRDLPQYNITQYWFRGGYPDSFLSIDDNLSNRWRENFIRTFVERDIPQLGINIPALKLRRFLTMCAHNQGQLLNSSKLGDALGVSYHTIRNYIDLLEQTFIIRTLQPYEVNVKKRIIKSPKVYIRDSGLLHSLLEIFDFNELLGHPVFGASWEGFALENILAELAGWKSFFYRTSSGNEIDLILIRGRKKIAVEFKSSKAPTVTKGLWNALEDMNIQKAWIIAPVDESYLMKEGVTVSGLDYFIQHVKSEYA
ncbi:MAG: ATP-binding protein [Proteobacteria bacterium]|nr:ATP-binding protein [Pseudomonadota bacterium]